MGIKWYSYLFGIYLWVLSGIQIYLGSIYVMGIDIYYDDSALVNTRID